MNSTYLLNWDTHPAESVDSRMRYLFLVRSGELGCRTGSGWRSRMDFNSLENSYIPRFEELGDVIRKKISPASSVHIASSAVGVGRETAEIIKSQLEGKVELEIAGCLGYLTEKIDKWNWAGDFGYNSREVAALVGRRRKEAEALILIGGIKVVKSYPGSFTDAEYNLQGRDIPAQLLPLYFGGLPHGYAWMFDLQKREWTVLPGPVRMYNEGCRQHHNDSDHSNGQRERRRKEKIASQLR